jgi:hypothetical protein
MDNQEPLDQHLTQENATKKSVLKWKAIQAEDQIIMAQRILFFIVALSTFSLWQNWATFESADIYLNAATLSIYFLCALFAKKYPLPSMIIALCLFLIPNLLILVLAPQLIVQSWLWKGVLFLALSTGFYNAIKSHQIKKELKDFEF